MTPERVGAFFEYVVRPFTEDLRLIGDRLKELQLPISEKTLRDAGRAFLLTQVALEFLRSATYITIAWLVCQTIIRTL